jgi:uncharacterized membrane protein
MERKRRLVPGVFVPLLIGIIGLSTLMRNPRFEAFHTVDVLQLIASGMCFGVALAVLLGMLRPARPS